MRYGLRNFWSGIVATFLSGLFALLPIVITVAIISWAGRKIYVLIGPGTTVGNALRWVGFEVVANEAAATAVGCVAVIVIVWAVGVLVKSRARSAGQLIVNATVKRIPFVKGIYGTASQVIGMLNRSDKDELSSMSVVYCEFGRQQGAGFLALLASPQTFRFHDRDCRVVYVPTSPIPMSGGIVFVPAECVTRVEMTAEQLMQIYLSLGVLTPQVVPARYQGMRDER